MCTVVREREKCEAECLIPYTGFLKTPATGSAAGALAGLLANQDHVQGKAQYLISQGQGDGSAKPNNSGRGARQGADSAHGDHRLLR